VRPVRITHGAVTETFLSRASILLPNDGIPRANRRITSPEHFDLLIFLDGKGRIEFGEGAEAYAPAECWLLPAALGAYQSC